MRLTLSINLWHCLENSRQGCEALFIQDIRLCLPKRDSEANGEPKQKPRRSKKSNFSWQGTHCNLDAIAFQKFWIQGCHIEIEKQFEPRKKKTQRKRSTEREPMTTGGIQQNPNALKMIWSITTNPLYLDEKTFENLSARAMKKIGRKTSYYGLARNSLQKNPCHHLSPRAGSTCRREREKFIWKSCFS